MYVKNVFLASSEAKSAKSDGISLCPPLNCAEELILLQCMQERSHTDGKITETAANYYTKNFLLINSGHNESNRERNVKK